MITYFCPSVYYRSRWKTSGGVEYFNSQLYIWYRTFFSGALVDLTGNTDVMFFVFGGVQIISGILLLIVKYLLRHQRKTLVNETEVALS